MTSLRAILARLWPSKPSPLPLVARRAARVHGRRSADVQARYIAVHETLGKVPRG